MKKIAIIVILVLATATSAFAKGTPCYLHVAQELAKNPTSPFSEKNVAKALQFVARQGVNLVVVPRLWADYYGIHYNCKETVTDSINMIGSRWTGTKQVNGIIRIDWDGTLHVTSSKGNLDARFETWSK